MKKFSTYFSFIRIIFSDIRIDFEYISTYTQRWQTNESRTYTHIDSLVSVIFSQFVFCLYGLYSLALGIFAQLVCVLFIWLL